jgi:hypothetical protein
LAAASSLLLAVSAQAQYRWVPTQLGNTNATTIITANGHSNYYSGVDLYATRTVSVEIRFKLLAAGSSNYVAWFAPANTTGKYDSNRIWTVTVPANGTTNENVFTTNFDASGFRYLYFLTASNGNASTMTNYTVTTGYKFGL